MALIQKIIHALLVVQPPHPIFVHFPIALISTAFFFLLLYFWRKNPILERIAFGIMCVAVVSIIVAASFGIWDNSNRFNGLAPNHIAKITIAITLFILTSVVVLWRIRKPDLLQTGNKWLYLAIHAVLFILVGIQGFLGGIIVYGF